MVYQSEATTRPAGHHRTELGGRREGQSEIERVAQFPEYGVLNELRKMREDITRRDTLSEQKEFR